MRRLLILCTLPCLLAADDRWVKFTAGPYEVLTGAGAHAGRETLVRFEEFRHALGQIVGENDLQTPLPVRIFVFRNAKGWTPAAPVAEPPGCRRPSSMGSSNSSPPSRSTASALP